jgi:hypothetical protein
MARITPVGGKSDVAAEHHDVVDAVLKPVFDTCVARTRGKYLIPLDIGSDWPDL